MTDQRRMTNKKNRLATAAAELKKKNVSYVELSPIHYRLEAVDFWPTTGRYFNRLTKEKGRGLSELLKIVEAGTHRYPPKSERATRCSPTCDQATLECQERVFKDGTVHLEQICEKCGRRKFLPRVWGIRAGVIKTRTPG